MEKKKQLKKEDYKAYGRTGGAKTLKKYGSDHFSKIAKKRHRDARKKRGS